eukprot:TRINITY_DN4407_c0_g1_i1.p1 TRINITY_DN4407_c0_g1~~TRINITY_DN4407_c0_g1_i1.p1  ORF type:complete len:450 (-),score=77.67 TRINITY_DN4407_c0_g1_i1:17-1222(-)
MNNKPPNQPKQPIKPDIRPVRVPVKVEPKTFFANERTLLQWLNSVVVLSTVALALIGLGEDSARLSGLILLPIALCFAIYSMVMYHIRRSSIKEHKQTPAYDDKFGPYILVIVFIAATIASVVVPVLHTDTTELDSNNSPYPFFPAIIPFEPKMVTLSGPLPVANFGNRTEGIKSLMGYLNTLPPTTKLYYDADSAIETIEKIKFYTTPIKNITHYFSLTTTTSTDTAYTTFKLFSTVPKFNSLPAPQVRPDFVGQDWYQFDMDCNGNSYYHASKVYNMPQVNNFQQFDYYISYGMEDLKADPSYTIVQDTSSTYSSVFTWKADALIDSNVCSVVVSLFYSSDQAVSPIDARLSIQLNSEAGGGQNIVKVIPYVRSVVTQIIVNQFGAWPTEQCQINKKSR